MSTNEGKAPGRVVFAAGLLSLLLMLGGSLATVGLSAAGVADSSGDCLQSDPSGVAWIQPTLLLALAGLAVAIIALIFGRHVAVVHRLPAFMTAACAIPVFVVAAMFAAISYGGEC